METFQELINKLTHEMLSCGYSESTINRSHNNILHHLLHEFGLNCEYNEQIIYDFCFKLFKHDIFNCPKSNLTPKEQSYRRAFQKLINYNKGLHLQPISTIHYHRDFLLDDNTLNLLENYVQKSKEDGNCERTLQNKRSRLRNFIIDSGFPNLTIDTVKEYLNNKKSKTSLIAYVIDIRLIRRFLIYCYQQGIISKEILINWPDQVPNIRDKTIPSTYSIEEIKILLKSASENTTSKNQLRNFAILSLIAYSGIRAKDAADLKLNDIDWHNDQINIIQSKTKKSLTIPLIAEIGNPIVEYIKKERQSKNEYLFLKENGEKISTSDVTSIISNYFRMSPIIIGDRHFGPHSLRHSIATNLINNSVSAFEVANTLGHSNINSVKIYSKVDVTSLRKCVLEAPYRE